MENKEQIQFLAKTAMQSKNYSQAFEYYSKLLENDINDQNSWLGKAIAAAHLSTLDTPRASEAAAYIKASMEFGEFTKEEKQNISKELINIAEQKINDGISFINREIEKRFNEKQMGTFTMQPVHQTGRILIQMEVGKQYRSALTDNFDLIELAYQIFPTKENIEKLFENMNKVFIHSKANQNYFGALNELTEENKRINNLWNNAKAKLSQISPGFQVQSNSPQVNNSSGCFIATAAAGDYNHPTVLQLRHFRDNTLINNSLGRRFIKSYYKNSPSIADYIRTKKVLKKAIYFLFIKPLSSFTKIFN
jgi:tetratricopeptide (TPR) repeat protein